MNKLLAIFGLVILKKTTLQSLLDCVDEKVRYQKKGYGIDKYDAEDLESVAEQLKGEL